MTGTSYTDTGLTAGTDYSYTVQARDTADQTGPASGAVAVHTTGGTTTRAPAARSSSATSPSGASTAATTT